MSGTTSTTQTTPTTSDTTTAAPEATTTASSAEPDTSTTVGPVYQNYILYRTVALMWRPSYTYLEGTTPVAPEPRVSAAKGQVIAIQSLSGLTGVTTPDGFAYALDADGKYPIGSIYTPPDSTTTDTTTPSAT